MNPHQLIAGFFGRLSRRAIRRPRTALIAAIAITLMAAPGMLRLKLRTDGHALVSPAARKSNTTSPSATSLASRTKSS